MKIIDLKKHRVVPPYGVLFRYCCDGAIGYDYGGWHIELFPELGLFTARRLRHIDFLTYFGRILDWDAEKPDIKIEVVYGLFDDYDVDETTLRSISYSVVYGLSYVNCKSFVYERLSETPEGLV